MNLSNFIVKSSERPGRHCHQHFINTDNRHSHHFLKLRFRNVEAFAPVHTARKWRRQHRNQICKVGQETVSLDTGYLLTFLDAKDMRGVGMKRVWFASIPQPGLVFIPEEAHFSLNNELSPPRHILCKKAATNVYLNSKYFLPNCMYMCLCACVCVCISISFIYSSSNLVCVPVLEDSLLFFSNNHKWLSYWNTVCHSLAFSDLVPPTWLSPTTSVC